jgi:outer membrane protein assembly factor BamB
VFGFSFSVPPGPPAENPSVGTNPNSLAVGDFNQDGRPDLVVANQGSNNLSILLGVGNGTFTNGVPLATGGSPVAVVVTKLNGDALPEIAVAVGPPVNGVRVFPATGLGIFGAPVDYFVGGTLQSLAAGDFTQDGLPDLLVGHGTNPGQLEVLISLGNGTLAKATTNASGGTGPLAVVAADFNEDGAVDLVVANENSNSLRFHRNDGAGNFSPAPFANLTSPRPQVLAVADFNRDGKKDLAVAYASSPVQALQGDGLGNFNVFTGPAPGIVARDLAVGDFDHDGKADLALADASSAVVRIYLGDGLGGFATTPVNLFTPVPPQSLVVGDFDANGLPDIVVGQGVGAGNLVVFWNNYGFTPPLGTAHFVATTPSANGAFVTRLAAADFNHDGWLDLVTNAAIGMQILLGNSSGTFTTSIPIDMDGASVSRIATGDFNGDGAPDVVATEGSLNSVSVHAWNGALGTITNPAYYAAAALGPATSSNPSGLAIGDFDGDGKPDIAVANQASDTYSIFRNTNCTSRRLTIVTEVPACDAVNSPFSPQPRIGVMDDGGDLNKCDASPVAASIVPGTGTAGANLSGGPLSMLPSNGIASFTGLKIDQPGRQYRLGFSHTVGSAIGRTFSQGLGVAISGGPLQLCLSQAAVFSAAAGFDSYTWTVDPPATPFSFLPNVTLSTLGVGSHTLEVTVAQDGCSATDQEFPNVNPDLASVTSTTPGPVVVCTSCVGGVVSEAHSGGGTITGYQWFWGTMAGGPYPNVIPSQTGPTYTINGADFPGPGTYFLVVRVQPTCGGPAVSTTQIVVQVQPSVPTDAVKFFTVTTAGLANTLQWVNPPSRNTVRIRRNTGTFSSCAFPSDPNGTDGSFFVGDFTGPIGSRDSRLDPLPTSVNTKYCYTTWVNLGGSSYGPGRSNSGRTFPTGGATQWAFSIGTLSLIPPGNGNNVVHTVAMDNSLHTVTKGSGGGTWPTAPMWMPQEMIGPSQGRPAGIPFNAGGASKLIFLGDQAGFVHAFNEDTGMEVWVTSQLGERIQAGASGIFTNFGGFADMLLVATYNTSTGNVLYALNPVNGNTIWAYDGDDGVVNNGLIGIISGQPAVDYNPANKRVYFASRAFGGAPDNKTVWCVNLTDGKSCWAQVHGDIDTGVTLQGSRLFVGTNSGTVLALNASDGTAAWGAPLVTGDGNVRNYVAPDRLTGDIYFSTSSKVWRVQASGTSASPIWSVNVANPSTPVYAPGDSIVYVGGLGSLFKLNVAGGGVAGSFLLGDGTSKVGSPTLDLRNGFAYVGTEAGVVYAVRIP